MVIAAVNYTGEHETIYIARAKRKNTTAAALHRPPPSTHTTPAAHSTNHATILDTFTPRARTKRENRGRPRAVAASTPPPPPPPPLPTLLLRPLSRPLHPIVSRARTTSFPLQTYPLLQVQVPSPVMPSLHLPVPPVGEHLHDESQLAP